MFESGLPLINSCKMNGGELDNKKRFGSTAETMEVNREGSQRVSSPLFKQHVNSLETSPRRGDLHQSRRETNQYKDSRKAAESLKAQAETELFDAKRTVRDLALKIDEANSRAKRLQPRKPRWREQENDSETSLKSEDNQYAQVMEELEKVKQELSKLKFDMTRVLKQKRRAERTAKASSSKTTTLSTSMDIIKKEIQELNEEQVLVELARIEAVKERDDIEAQRREEDNRYRTQLEEAKKKAEEIVRQNEMTRELQITLSDVNMLENELTMAKEMDRRIERTESMARRDEAFFSPALLNTITQELEAAKMELKTIKREGFNFMTSMDVIREELEHIREETSRLEKAEEKRDLIVQNLNSKILRGKAKLEAATAAEVKANVIASNLSLMLEQLRAESETAKKENELINEEIENIKTEIPKTESEIELTEKRLESAMEELKAVKVSESRALDDLKNLIETTVRARELDSLNSSTITITNFEYEYLTSKAGGAEEIADKKVAAAQAWVEAMKANEREILMKVSVAQREIRELSVEIEKEEEEGEGEITRSTQNGSRVSASPRRSVYRMRNMTPGKRARSQKLRSPAAWHGTKPSVKRRERVMPNLAKFFSNKNTQMDQ